jgi:ferredoxin
MDDQGEHIGPPGWRLPGTCGGIAFCATSAVDILSGNENLSQTGDQELDMLDTLPESNGSTRLAC